MFSQDTIVAVSSPVASAARIIVRVSGTSAFSIAEEFGVESHEPASASWIELQFDGLRCPAWVYQFKSPASYTGEDLVELHLPGNPLLARMAVDWALRHGALRGRAGRVYGAGVFSWEA